MTTRSSRAASRGAGRRRAAREQVETRAEPLEQRFGREELGAGGGELERQRQPVQALAELVDRGVRSMSGRTARARVRKSVDGLVRGERRQVELDLGADAKRLAARHEQAQRPARPRRGRRSRRRRRAGAARGCRARRACASSPTRAAIEPGSAPAAPSASASAGQHERRVAQRRERDEDRAAVGVLREQTCELDREAGLAGAAGAEDGEDARVALEHDARRRRRARLPPEEAAWPAWAGSTAPGVRSGGKAVAAELVAAAPAPSKSLSRWRAEVEERRSPSSRAAVARESEHLAAVGERRDPRAAVDVDADVALAVTVGVPVCRPMRTRIGPGSSALVRRRARRPRAPARSGRRRRTRRPACRPRRRRGPRTPRAGRAGAPRAPPRRRRARARAAAASSPRCR